MTACIYNNVLLLNEATMSTVTQPLERTFYTTGKM